MKLNIKTILKVIGRKKDNDYLEDIKDTKDNLIEDKGKDLSFGELTNLESKFQAFIEYANNNDKLTGLYNRSYFKSEIKQQCEKAKKEKSSFALLLLGIDGLSYVNDALGYEVGDKVIIEVVKRLKVFLGNTDLIYRYLGDKFFIFVPELSDFKEYESISNDIIKLFSKPIKIDLHKLSITVSIGGAIYPKDGEDLNTLKKHANSALISAKSEGKNRYEFYSSNMSIQSYMEFTLRNDLRKAIEDNEFRVYYQPQVNLKTGEILGAEALLRWNHPIWGVVQPVKFISLAEETGLIVDVGKWVLREICKKYKEWIKAGLPKIKISVNCSSIQFIEKDFISDLKNIVGEFNLNPNFLIIEITESMFMKNYEKEALKIRELRKLGIEIALDDFGVGYSSFQHLSSLDIDILKIDKTFINNAINDKTNDIITRSIVNLAQELKLKLVAEGIETIEQLSYLQSLNCYEGQGYLYSKPVPVEEFEKDLIRKRFSNLKDNNVATKGKNKRSFFRVPFFQPLEGYMTISIVNDAKVNLKYTKILIKDIGPGGLCFISNIKLPINKNIILRFKTHFLEKDISECGHVTWLEKSGNGLYEYGVEFILDENERNELTKLFNMLQIKMKTNPYSIKGSFISESPVRYFNSIS